MRFTDINVCGIYVAPIAVLMVAAWLALLLLRRLADRFGLLCRVWHPALLVFAVYIMLLSAMVQLVAWWRV